MNYKTFWNYIAQNIEDVNWVKIRATADYNYDASVAEYCNIVWEREYDLE